MSTTLRVLVAIVPDLSEPGGRDILEEILATGDRIHVGNCVIVEADMDALALMDVVEEVKASRLVILGPLHRDGRRRGLYERVVEPQKPSNIEPLSLVRELWGNLTGSLKLQDYEAALKILYGKPFTVVECEPGTEGCRGLIDKWVKENCVKG